ncbi:MAG: hypothetical protein UR23_C0059G0011 [Candidatus Roizmanbacteria bacterium GW2011_GWA2_32_13]|uniref:Uncharacterized protein n=1 Tax=Candidatus Roizmanbacteria bacterium GW2011_GWA2_32_13 TaxID=1618475 RepID=A0A0F9YM30_9BACT|nr:MAG: hypothetical protein UR23_C0059G0011 [Candidatus Roizmanbacteria bacterium GW2011_GWA2_32_13]
MLIFDKKWQKAFYKGLSAISGNLSAGYFGIIVIMPALNKLTVSVDYLFLIFDSMMGILLLVLTIVFERKTI